MEKGEIKWLNTSNGNRSMWAGEWQCLCVDVCCAQNTGKCVKIHYGSMACSVFGFTNTSMNNYTDRIKHITLLGSSQWLFDVFKEEAIQHVQLLLIEVTTSICRLLLVCVHFPRHRHNRNTLTSISDDSLTWTLTNGFENILFNFPKCRWLNANLS